MSMSAWIQSFTSIATRKNYWLVVRDFLRSVYDIKYTSLDEGVERYLTERASDIKLVKQDVDKYILTLAKYAPKTRSQRRSIVKTFLADMYFEINDSFWRKFSRRDKGKARAISVDRVPTNEEIRRVMQHLPSKGRAVFLFMASSGCRIGETVLMELDDIDLTSVPSCARLRGVTVKGGQSRTVFFTQEAREAIEEWLKVREVWIVVASERGFQPEEMRKDPTVERRVFPFGKTTAQSMWRRALRKAGLFERDPNTGRATIKPHCLRKRFRTQLASRIPVDIVETLMGHEGYETDSYRRYSEEKLAEEYIKGQHVLFISIGRSEIEVLRDEIEDEILRREDRERRLTALEQEFRDMRRFSTAEEKGLEGAKKARELKRLNDQ